MREEIKSLQFGLLKATNVIRDSFTKEEFNEALKIIGEAAQLGRVYVCENHKNKATEEIYFKIIFEWTADLNKINVEAIDSKKILYSQFSLLKLYENLSQGNPLKFILNNLPGDLKSCFNDKRVKSIIFIPVMVKNTYWGFFGFEEFKLDRNWTDEEVKIFSELAIVFADSIENRDDLKSFNTEKKNQTIKLVDAQSIISLFEEEKPGVDFFIDLFDILLKDIPSVSIEIETAVKNHDFENLKFYSHKLGGTLIVLGAKSTLDTCNRLENIAREKIIDEKVQNLYAVLQKDLNQILNEIKILRGNYFKFASL
ncbi:MAG: Hpt domain-containing protein [Ignavibacteriaceae bacterium]